MRAMFEKEFDGCTCQRRRLHTAIDLPYAILEINYNR
jgi:hypothetical protein